MARSVEEAFAQVRDAVATALAQLAAAKPVPVSPAEVGEAVAALVRRLERAETELPVSLSAELERWMCDACEIKTDHITSLTTLDNVGGQKAAAASFRDNVNRVSSDVATVAFVARCVATPE